MQCFDWNRAGSNSQLKEVEILINKPDVPFTLKLNERICPNTTFLIQGIVDDNAVQFAVNLMAGHSEKSDIVFHFNPRLTQLYSARNSRFNGVWGTEDVASHLKFPFRCGQPFLLEIYTTDIKYLVAVDGKQYCTYKHRAPLASVVGLRVEGGVRLSQILHFSTSTYPSMLPQLLMLPDTKKECGTKIISQVVSVVYNFKSHLQTHSSIIVQGVVDDYAMRFEVNLLTLSHENANPNIGFHFNPRLDQGYTARNTRLQGLWGSEEGGPHENFPFQRGQSFYLEIYVTAAKFMVAVDGLHYTSYRHRVALDSLVKVHVRGDVALTNVHCQKTFKYPSGLPQFLCSSEQILLQAGDYSKNSDLRVPFVHDLKARLHPQSSVIVQGVVENNATRFEVDFIIGHEEKPDIAFHVNPRLDQLYIARNSRFNGVWGHEEGESERKFPFRCGQPFFLEIFLTESKFMVAVDGTHYCSFKYRASLVSITRLSVQGGVRLSQILLHPNTNYPTPMPDYLLCPDIQPVVLHRANNATEKSEPFIHKLDFQFYPQSSLIVQGEVADNGVRFAVNLLIDNNKTQDIAFHFNPRLNQGYTARNAKLGGSWGVEEGNNQEKFPFRNGFKFNLEIFFTHSKFMVAVDGVHYCKFKYRVPLAKISSVQVEGGVLVHQVLVHATANYPSLVLEFVPLPENKPGLQAVRAGSVSSLNQALPIYYELRSSLHPQSSIFVQGVVGCRTIRLEFNLLMGRGEHPDIAFHFNPRLDQLYSARNTRLNSIWGEEEGNSHQRFPFVRGKRFYLEIFLTHSEYMVAVNGIHYCTYSFRVPLQKVTCVEVRGVTGALVEVRPVSSYPSSPPSSLVECSYRLQLTDHSTTENYSQITPVYAALSGNLRANSMIEIRGKVKLLPFSFYVNLQEGSEHWPHPLIPFHTSLRFCQDGEQVALANSWIRKDWGKEERVNKFLFIPGHSFTMRITCQEDKFMVYVDDNFLLAYKHRVPYTNVNLLLIQGDVFIYSITQHL